MSLSPPIAPLLHQTSRIVIAAQIGSQIVSIGSLAVLARMLGPGPYGLVGMVMPLVAIVRILITSGLDVVTVQQANLSERQISALFWINQGLGATMTLLMAAAAPLMARLYGVPEAGWVTVALSGTSIAFVLSMQHLAMLQRRFRLGTVAVLRLAALAVAGLTGIALAFAGAGVWALVIQQYAELLTLALLAWTLEPWRPHFVLRGVGARQLVRFGGHIGVGSLMFYLVANADKVLVGFWFKDEVPVALYNQAFNLMWKPVHVLVTPLTGVMLPALTRAADRDEYARLLGGFTRFIALVMLPAGVGLAIVAPETMRVVCGREWTAAGPILSVLAVTLIVQGFLNSLWTVFASTGHAARFSTASVVIAAVLCAAYPAGLYFGNLAGDALLGLAVAYTVAVAVLVFPAYLAFGLRTARMGVGQWARHLLPAAPAAVGMGLLVGACHWLLGHVAAIPDLLLLVAELAVGVASYLFFVRREAARILAGTKSEAPAKAREPD